MAFIQLIDIHTDQFTQIEALDKEWERQTEGRNTVRRTIITQDRDDPQHYAVLVFFDSHDEAMENSRLPETHEMSAKMAALATKPFVFTDLDVIDDRT
jgi:hypothetical protein